MQREAPLTPRSAGHRRINRPAPVTPDRSHAASTESFVMPQATGHGRRATIAPGDVTISGPGLFGKKRLQMSMAGKMDPDMSRRMEPDNNDLRLMYEECLRTVMVELLMKKKAEENEKVMISQLGMLAKEDDALDEKLRSMRVKERDLRSLIELQDDLDANYAEITACLKEFEKKPVQILAQLKSMLESLDTLKCRNIVIPESPEDMQKIHQLFAKCSDILRSINDCIGTKSDTVCTVNRELTEFTRVHSEVQNYAKKAEEALCSLQIEVLKDAARTISQNELKKSL